MVSILITAAAYEAIRASFEDGSGPPQAAEGEMIRIWLEESIVNRLKRLRGRGESYSDVIVRLVKETREAW